MSTQITEPLAKLRRSVCQKDSELEKKRWFIDWMGDKEKEFRIRPLFKRSYSKHWNSGSLEK